MRTDKIHAGESVSVLSWTGVPTGGDPFRATGTYLGSENGIITVRVEDGTTRTFNYGDVRRLEVPRTYIRGARAWWAASNEIGPGRTLADEIILGQDDPQREVTVEFHDFAATVPSEQGLAARFSTFDESWAVYAEWDDLFKALAAAAVAGGGIEQRFRMGPDEFETILKRLGFKDVTPTAQPTS